MFTNIGKKIKTAAKICCWLEMAVFIIVGLSILEEGNESGSFIVILGILFSVLSSWMIYGYGEIIDILQQGGMNPRPFTNLSDLSNPSVPADSKAKKIMFLYELRKEGLISEEDFNQQMRKIHEEY